MKVYGDDVKITKEECTNHVAKRMGTALRKLATQINTWGTWRWQVDTGYNQTADCVLQ